MTQRNILVFGATGKQGRALIRALLSSDGSEYHVLALTRNASSPNARLLLDTAKNGYITLVEGNLDNVESIRDVFVKNNIWGVYAVLAYPGLGVKDDREEQQGKMLANLALEFKVGVFIYSSSIQASNDPEEILDFSHYVKWKIGNHCQELSEKGLNWVILKPGFFMENFEGSLGALAFTLLSKGLPKDTTIAMIASEDIGKVAAGVIKNHERFLHKELAVTGDVITTTQIAKSWQTATGKPMPTVPGFAASLLLRINSGAQTIVKETLQNHQRRITGKYQTFDSEVALAKSASSMQTYYEWKLKQQSEDAGLGNWNKVSFWKLITGRS